MRNRAAKINDFFLKYLTRELARRCCCWCIECCWFIGGGVRGLSGCRRLQGLPPAPTLTTPTPTHPPPNHTLPAVPEERKKLRVREPERFGWHPKQLITQVWVGGGAGTECVWGGCMHSVQSCLPLLHAPTGCLPSFTLPSCTASPPTPLLQQLAQIHLHLYRARRTEWVEVSTRVLRAALAPPLRGSACA